VKTRLFVLHPNDQFAFCASGGGGGVPAVLISKVPIDALVPLTVIVSVATTELLIVNVST